MTASEIKEYLGVLYELEKERYMQERLKYALNKKANSLGHAKQIAPPSKKKGDTFELVSGGLISFPILTCIGGIIGGIVSIFTKISSKNGLLYGAIAGAVILAVILIVSIVQGVLYNKEEYEMDCINYQNALEEDRQRLEREKAALMCVKLEYARIDACYTQTCCNLNKLYRLNILFEKYHHNFAAVSTLYEYFCAGRFKTLEDAYNQLELEVRLDRICLKLDIIISKLDEIKDNQFMIYNAITQASSKLSSLLSSCNRLESRVEQLQAQGNELSSQIFELQTTSDLTLYVNALNNRELTLMRRWIKD